METRNHSRNASMHSTRSVLHMLCAACSAGSSTCYALTPVLLLAAFLLQRRLPTCCPRTPFASSFLRPMGMCTTVVRTQVFFSSRFKWWCFPPPQCVRALEFSTTTIFGDKDGIILCVNTTTITTTKRC